MLPLYPPYPFVDLAHEHLEGRLPDGRPRRHHPLDPDGFNESAASLQPDPVFMGIRGMVTAGPIGALVHWIEHRIEAREDRRGGARLEDVTGEAIEPGPSAVPAAGHDRQPQRKIAA